MFKKIALTAFVISAIMLTACGNSNTSTIETTTTSPPVTTTVATEVITTTTEPVVTTAPTTVEVETTTCLTLDKITTTEPIVTTVPTTTSPPVTVTTTTTAQTTITTTEPIVTTAPTTVEQTTTTSPPVVTTTATATDEEPFYNADGSVNKNRWHYCEDIEQEILDEYNIYRAENNLPCNYTQNEAWASYADRLVYYMSEYMQLQHSMSVMEVISSTHYTTGSDVLQGFVNSPKHNDLLLGVCNGYNFDIEYVAVSSYSGHLLYTVIILEDRTFEEYFNNLTKVLITEYWFENKFNISEETMINIRDNMTNDEKYAIFIEKGYDKYYPHLVR